MHATLSWPVTTVSAAPKPAAPDYRTLFLEPRYADGQPYDTTAGGEADDEGEGDLEAA